MRGARAVAAALLLLGTPAAAQRACLPLDRALRAAVDIDPRIGRAGAARDEARAQIDVLRAEDRPQLSAFTRNGAGDGVRADNQLDNRAGLRLSQRLFTFGRARLARDAAALRARSAEFGIEDARLDVAADVAERHIGIARGEERAAAAGIIADYYARDAGLADRRLAAGLVKLSEASGVKAEHARAQARRAEELLRVEQERTALATLVGSAVQCVDAASGAAFLGGLQPASVDLALADAEARSPALGARAADRAAAEAERRREARGGLPDIGLSGVSALDYGRTFNGLANSNRIGLDITAPIYQGGQVRARTDVAGARARGADFEVAQQRRALAEAVRVAWLRARELGSIAALNRTTLDALVAQADALEREYGASLVTLSDLIDARRQEYDGRLAEIDARYDLLAEQFTLARLTGRLLDALAASRD